MKAVLVEARSKPVRFTLPKFLLKDMMIIVAVRFLYHFETDLSLGKDQPA